ncbi:hypothetical protein GCM10027610_070980 [Dactylosporangium cerinum]
MAVEHLRNLVMMVFGVFPLAGIVCWLMLIGTDGETDTSFRIEIGVIVAAGILIAGAPRSS